MAPIKFEENIKEKLEKRTLEPSANAWASLERQLHADAKKQNKTKFWWFGIAASIVGILFVTQQFVNYNNANSGVSTTVVEMEKEVLTNSVKTPLIIKKSQEIVQETLKESAKENIIEVNKNSQTITNTTVKRNRKEKQQAVVAVAKKQEEETPRTLNNLVPDIEETVAVTTNIMDASTKDETQIATLKTSESEIESLLAAATKKIQLTDTHAVKSVSVNANTLLEAVETEMPPSLRTQLFKVIEKNFKTATTAVTTRNK
ncbi:hypothetical protein KO494_10185 [Lacinutrix sp. C3R15]|uniref:hypothetical protein n=1 Tax=Flavobacteriaceae TaxID=49546 RepID=UPI001C09507A|nr:MULTISPECIES: hypothetical protein [Flavobacteriaceae]MBU2939907.1 hypothetical protein [Lacinutrix sp. C3R15]MDO6623223.1 hypothetical protein [Oceanihabitans sp. 1_MG-2023]